jgi:TolB-like protein/Tfp pilus assembly protein PilF
LNAASQAVFISYASEDAEVAGRICAALRAAGIEVWFDRSELRGGDAWDQKIRREIRDCALFVPVISRTARLRSEGYFRLEWRLADQRTHLMAKGRAFLLPIVIDDTNDAEADVPDSFTAVQWTRIPDGEVAPAFMQRVLQLLAANAPGAAGAAGSAAASEAPGRGTGSPRRVSEKSIAVLPFTNLSAEKESEYFSDGLAEEILNALSQVEELSVAARSSSFSFKGKATEAGEVARRLHVAHVLEGSVRRAGERLRVTVQLIDARNGFQLWSERYDRKMEDIFEIQEQIARAIAERLRVTLAAGIRRGTENLEAYELYLRGRHYWHERSPATLRMAVQYFEQGIAIDPGYALAYAGLADCYGILNFYGWLPASVAQPKAQAAMARAVALGSSLWECHFSHGFYLFYFDAAWRDAESHFRKALSLNPRSSLACTYYGLWLANAGREQESVEFLSRACELDPLAPLAHGLNAAGLCGLRRFDAAERAALHALELQPTYVLASWWLGIAYYGHRRYAEGVQALEQVVVLSRAPIFVGVLGLGYGYAGRVEDARSLLRELEDRGSRGEHIPIWAPLAIQVGLADIPAVRQGLRAVAARPAEQYTVRAILGCFLREALRTDPEIDRAHRQLFGW